MKRGQGTLCVEIDGKVVGTQPALTVCEQTVGELFVLLQVSNRYGTASEELRVDVVELEIPTISLPVPEKGIRFWSAVL